MDENPVEMNLTPAINIIFCLIVFFMSCFKFKALEGKMDSWLPKDKGIHGTPISTPVLEDIKVWMKWDPENRRTIRKVNQSDAHSDSDLQSLLAQRKANFEAMGKNDVPVSLDAGPDVPWRDVIWTLNLCKREKLEKIEFAAPWPEAPPK